MTKDLSPFAFCADMSGLQPHEMVLGVTPADRHEQLLSAYLARGLGREALSTVLAEDIRAAICSGAAPRAADLLIVLRRVLAREQKARTGAARRSSKSVIRLRTACARAPRSVERRQTPACAVDGNNVLFLDAFRRARRG